MMRRKKGTFIANKRNFFTFALRLGRKGFYFGPQQTFGEGPGEIS